jgi:Fe-S cluster biosynthesis and repair protein YggX
MSDVNCVRCGQPGPQLPAPPLPTKLGGRIYDAICRDCWGQWLKHQTAMINHYALDLREPEARKFLAEQTELYLFGQPKA